MLSPSMIMGGVALLPAIVLFVYIYKKDRKEKEPTGLILKLILYGVFTVAAALVLEEVMQIVLDIAFHGVMSESGDSVSFTSESAYYAYYLCVAFIQAGLCEEGSKWFFLNRATRRNKNFNSMYDGIVYAVVISLTFAAIENVKYVWTYSSLSTAVTRAFTAIPGHCFFAILMGIFYSRWHIAELAATLEKRLVENGTVKMRGLPVNTRVPMVLSIVVPILVHGLYDYFAFTGSGLFYVLLAVMYVLSFVLIKKYSQNNEADTLASTRIIRKKYPEYNGMVTQCFANAADTSDERIRTLTGMTPQQRVVYGRQTVSQTAPAIDTRYRQIAPLLPYDVRSYIVSPSRDIIAAIFYIAGSADGVITPLEKNYISAITPDGSYMDSLNKLVSRMNLMQPAERQTFAQHMLSAATVTAGKEAVLSLCYAFCTADGNVSVQEMNLLNMFSQSFNQ